MTSIAALGLTLIASLLGAVGALFFKFGADKLSFKLKAIITNWRLYTAVFFYGASTVFFIWALSLKGSQLSIVYPFIALTYVWVELLSIRFLKEKMNIWKWAGIALIIIGVSFIGLGG